MIVEATGVPQAGIAHALKAIAHGKHIVMVNVEADALAGPLLARKAKAAGVVYSLAWGDQPALICEHVDWARACGFKVIAAGKGTRYEPHYHQSNPDNVWDILDKYLKITDRNSINPKMFNSFVDGTKSGIEMTAVCNATGLVPQSDGSGVSARDAVRARRNVQAEERRRHAGEGRRHRGGRRRSIATGATCRIIWRSAPMWCSRARPTTRGAASRNTPCCRTASGRYAALYRPIHMIGLELGISVASRGAAQGADRRADRLPLRRGGDRQAAI